MYNELFDVERHVREVLVRYKDALGMASITDPATGISRRKLFAKLSIHERQAVLQGLSARFHHTPVRVRDVGFAT